MSQSGRSLTLQPYINPSTGRQEVVVTGSGIENPTVASELTRLGGTLNRSIGAFEFPADTPTETVTTRDLLTQTFPTIAQTNEEYRPSLRATPAVSVVRTSPLTVTPAVSVVRTSPLTVSPLTASPLLSNPTLTIRSLASNLPANALVTGGGSLAVIGPSVREPTVATRLTGLGGTFAPDLEGYQFFAGSAAEAAALEEALTRSFPTALLESSLANALSQAAISRPASPRRGLSHLSRFLPENNVISGVVPTSPDLVVTASTPTTSVTVETSENAGPVVQITQPASALSVAPRLTTGSLTQPLTPSLTQSLVPIAVTTPTLPLTSRRTIIPSVGLSRSGRVEVGQLVRVSDPLFGTHEYTVTEVKQIEMVKLESLNPGLPDIHAVSQGGVWKVAGLPNSRVELL